MKPLNKFHNMKNGAPRIAATLWFGVSEVVIIPKKVKYISVKYMKYTYQRNFHKFHSKAAMK